MTIELAHAGLLVGERDALCEALEHRRRALKAALRLYEGAPIEHAPRLALVRRTRIAMAEIDRGLAQVHDTAYGVCRSCERAMPVARLTLRPLATDCAECAPFDAPSATRL